MENNKNSEAIQESQEKFKELINALDKNPDKSTIKKMFNDFIKPSEKLMDYGELIKECLNNLPKKEKTKIYDLFSLENKEKRDNLLNVIDNERHKFFKHYPLNIDFINNVNAINSKGEHIFEVIAKNPELYNDYENLGYYYSGYNDIGLSEPNYAWHKNLNNVFSLSVDQDLQTYLLDKYAPSYKNNDDSKKVLDFAMENMGNHQKQEFEKKIASYSKENTISP